MLKQQKSYYDSKLRQKKLYDDEKLRQRKMHLEEKRNQRQHRRIERAMKKRKRAAKKAKRADENYEMERKAAEQRLGLDTNMNMNRADGSSILRMPPSHNESYQRNNPLGSLSTNIHHPFHGDRVNSSSCNSSPQDDYHRPIKVESPCQDNRLFKRETNNSYAKNESPTNLNPADPGFSSPSSTSSSIRTSSSSGTSSSSSGSSSSGGGNSNCTSLSSGSAFTYFDVGPPNIGTYFSIGASASHPHTYNPTSNVDSSSSSRGGALTVLTTSHSNDINPYRTFIDSPPSIGRTRRHNTKSPGESNTASSPAIGSPNFNFCSPIRFSPADSGSGDPNHTEFAIVNTGTSTNSSLPNSGIDTPRNNSTIDINVRIPTTPNNSRIETPDANLSSSSNNNPSSARASSPVTNAPASNIRSLVPCVLDESGTDHLLSSSIGASRTEELVARDIVDLDADSSSIHDKPGYNSACGNDGDGDDLCTVRRSPSPDISDNASISDMSFTECETSTPRRTSEMDMQEIDDEECNEDDTSSSVCNSAESQMPSPYTDRDQVRSPTPP
ncbi:hypothetical protein BGW38_007409 [Lunasporangiospora selenospora]|uniref:Uncharacterized protein n=1 Tax=Lunasporangiospora selenospora TaxID=979761 RepID=A0A9P6KGL3_9FUNG|nr:hypothetical protein BGW38_007409 [Lunasporangiospora selenospora]